jgi:sialate O-acetylesterase
MKKIHLLACVASLLIPAALRADVKVASLFTDHMVLQRDMPLPVWGTADAGEQVTVKVGSQSKTATADDKGKWSVKLDPLAVGGPVTVEVAGKNAVKLDDVLVGDVWVCSGQSNMTFALMGEDNSMEEIQAADHPKIRLFSVPKTPSPQPLDAVKASWEACDPKTAEGFTAVGYFFGRDLQKDLDIPIGLIHTSWGGTVAEAWTDSATLKADPDFAPILKRGEEYPANYPKLMEAYERKVKAFQATNPGEKLPATLRKPQAPDEDPNLPSVLFNGMVAPLEPFAIKGVIWYQGEANAGRAWQYRKLLPAMIQDWRSTWGEGDFPFLIVQLANYGKDKPDGSSDWAELREAQALTARNVPHCGLAVTIDIGNPANIHPTDKQDVGKRLALQAEKIVYGKDVLDAGPTYASMAIDGPVIGVMFDHVGGGLVAKDGKLEGFSIAGEDQKFVPAEAKIDGSVGSIVDVSAPSVAKPVAIRYGWANSPTCTLFNKEGLPAAPFRTDDWKAVTADAK